MFELPVGRPAVMGVLNVTPDSFSDGGRYLDPGAAAAAGIEMLEAGADLIDVGGESTRPGASPVPESEELRRVVPVLERLAGAPVSIDTRKPAVARAALALGVSVVNDVGGLREPEMLRAVAESSATICLVHMRGEPATMQDGPVYADVVAEVLEFLLARAEAAEAGGLGRERVWIDPGIGFGKLDPDNFRLLREVGRFAATGYPVVVGVSRKGFLGRALEGAPAEARLHGALAAQTLAQAGGARVLRTHDVRATREAARVAEAVLRA